VPEPSPLWEIAPAPALSRVLLEFDCLARRTQAPRSVMELSPAETGHSALQVYPATACSLDSGQLGQMDCWPAVVLELR
jgi:hypothetical protein